MVKAYIVGPEQLATTFTASMEVQYFNNTEGTVFSPNNHHKQYNSHN